jgi:hypothetical protein
VIKRILITGSRDWADMTLIMWTLSWAWKSAFNAVDSSQMVLVSGACPTGADSMCEQIAHTWGWTVEPHPADWSLGKWAGPKRNQEMVDAGAEICLAFIRNNSRGATGTAAMAEAAGIPTVRFVINDN